MKHYAFEIDNKIQQGYTYILEDQIIKGCDLWLDAWEGIKTLLNETESKDIFELNKKYAWTDSISNYAQHLGLELGNAGRQDALYHQKRIIYCQELLSFCGKDERMLNNTLQAIGEAHKSLVKKTRKKRTVPLCGQ